MDSDDLNEEINAKQEMKFVLSLKRLEAEALSERQQEMRLAELKVV